MVSLSCLLVKSLREGSTQYLRDFGHFRCLSTWRFFYWSSKHSVLREEAGWLDTSRSVDPHLPVQGWTLLAPKSCDVQGHKFCGERRNLAVQLSCVG